MSDAQRATVDAHRARIYLHGRLHMLRPRLAGVIPAETGAMALQEGRRFRIEDVRRTAADLTLTVATRRIQEPSPFGTYAHENDLIAHGPVEYVVIAEDERVVEALSRRGGGGSGHGLVLPGPLLYQETLELAMLDRRSITTMPLGEHPKLGLVEWDLVASIPIMSEIPNLRLDAR